MLCHGTDKDTNSYTYYIFLHLNLLAWSWFIHLAPLTPLFFLFYFIFGYFYVIITYRDKSAQEVEGKGMYVL